VGPACYEPDDKKVRQKTKITDFTTNKIKRKVFEPLPTADNFMPGKEVPGPGAYDFNTSVYDKKNFNT
jgi:hypothetical protein